MMESNLYGMVNGYEYYDVSYLPNQTPNLGFGVPSSSDFDLRLDRIQIQPSIWVPSTQQHQDQDSPPGADEIDSENTLLKYVNQLLMEEETLAENQTLSYDSLALRQTEEMLQQVITDSQTQSPYISTSSSNSSGSGGEYLNRSYMLRQPANKIMFSDADSVNQFKRGVEEASKFLPNTDQWIFNQDEKVYTSRVRKHHHQRGEEEEHEEARMSKQSASNVDDGKLTEMFDKVLLLDNQLDPQINDNVSSKAPASKKERVQAVDFRTLLILCAQSISSGDMITSVDLLRQIRNQSSPLGDASQRLAHFFANALEARLQGSSGGVIQSYYDAVTSKKRTAAQILKSYKTFLSASPFMTLMYLYSNKMILDVAKDASVLHVIDFGILYGFQWPMFIQRISESKNGPRKLRITGVELPQNGFRPTEKLEDTGRRLREYCKRFGVPFEYNAIASKNWETIRLEEFKIRPNEVLAVNAVLRFKNLRDVTPGEEDCPREGFLKLIRDMKPDVVLNSTVNGSFNASFFTTRFKEALFHYTAVFDMFGSTLSRENPERMHFEEVFYGREVMNVIACEGVDRVERPETYKQWQVRMMRAGFKQKPVETELVESFREKMKRWGYHKDFVLDEDSNWFLQVNGHEYYDVSFLPNQIPDLGFGVPSSSDFDLRLDHHHHHQQPSYWIPSTQQDQDSPPGADEIDSENTLLKYVNQLLMEETLSENHGYGQPANEILVRSMFSDADSVNQFKRGLEEASKFLPNTDQWIFNPQHEVISVKDEKGFSRVRKHHHQEPEEEEARRSKQSAVNVDDGNISELFDKVLLLDNQLDPQIKEETNNVSSKKEGGRGKKKSKAVDFRTLLTLCAQSISSGDKLAADDLLNQIKKQCSPLGDASQRLAYFFTKALEARLQGSSGVMIQSYYDSITSKKRTAAQILKTYKAFLSASPFMTLIYFFSNKMILDASKDASVLHIIDFGILYGFQWPMFIQYISKSKIGPRKLRITGVELPQNGFRPTEKIEDTGRRLREYCKRFGVPFEYNAIASKNWETIRLEEFKIRPNEVLAVNSVLRLKNLRDVTPGEEDCPRDGFLKLIRDMKPDVFLSSTINGSFNAPFFATRFKEALFHYSSLFDMFGSTLSKENPERMHFEGEFFGREVMNVIACEGVDRVERPETYKQWQVRMMRAGFKQKPVETELVESFREKMKRWGYHKDFVLDEDSNWFLQGWKGRILFSSSCWVPS
ncbi:hypothetical protein HID58_083809 [Brassica napus]|uniref:Uncharacterized protein n=1 Tax=Brassica napus TaxID=3708 RepID=A0ABQ7YEB3_BRANA|nr:hypothetical protein HID58_083809 [Brassica napus]